MKTLGMTHSACPACRAIVPAKVVERDGKVHFRKFCVACGESEALVCGDAERYLSALRYVKPALVPLAFAGDASRGCPDGCGFCEAHEQHLCMPIVEITSRCDLSCPACLVTAGQPWEMSVEQFAGVLDRLLAAERQIDVLNLSGGEPLLHPRLTAIVDEAVGREQIIRVSISTNGLRLLEDPGLLAALHERDVVISLQMDGFAERAYELLRGRPMLAEKLRILDALAEAGVTTSLTMTAARGVNEDQFRPMLDYLFANEHVVSLMIQPAAYVGRGENLPGRDERLTIPDVVAALGAAGHPAVTEGDFTPLPCSHPLCFSLAFYLMLDGGGSVAVGGLVAADELLDAVANRTVFGLDRDEYERLREMVYALWSGPAGSVPESEAVMATLRGILRQLSGGRFDAKRTFALAERRVKSIFLHAFQDADTFDLARVRRCCNGYPQADGTLIPACVQNVLRRTR
jgi:uncharacterized radical SAM superfamily Fe-S cluster-containing enzyme